MDGRGPPLPGEQVMTVGPMLRRASRARILFADIDLSLNTAVDFFDDPDTVMACANRLWNLYGHRLEDQARDWGVHLTPHPARVMSAADTRSLLEALCSSIDLVRSMPPSMWDDDPYLPRHAFTVTYAYLTALPPRSAQVN